MVGGAGLQRVGLGGDRFRRFAGAEVDRVGRTGNVGRVEEAVGLVVGAFFDQLEVGPSLNAEGIGFGVQAGRVGADLRGPDRRDGDRRLGREFGFLTGGGAVGVGRDRAEIVGGLRFEAGGIGGDIADVGGGGALVLEARGRGSAGGGGLGVGAREPAFAVERGFVDVFEFGRRGFVLGVEGCFEGRLDAADRVGFGRAWHQQRAWRRRGNPQDGVRFGGVEVAGGGVEGEAFSWALQKRRKEGPGLGAGGVVFEDFLEPADEEVASGFEGERYAGAQGKGCIKRSTVWMEFAYRSLHKGYISPRVDHQITQPPSITTGQPDLGTDKGTRGFEFLNTRDLFRAVGDIEDAAGCDGERQASTLGLQELPFFTTDFARTALRRHRAEVGVGDFVDPAAHHPEEVAGGVELLDPVVVLALADVDGVGGAVDGDVLGADELAGARARAAEVEEEGAGGVEDVDAVVAGIGDVEAAVGGIDGDAPGIRVLAGTGAGGADDRVGRGGGDEDEGEKREGDRQLQSKHSAVLHLIPLRGVTVFSVATRAATRPPGSC